MRSCFEKDPSFWLPSSSRSAASRLLLFLLGGREQDVVENRVPRRDEYVVQLMTHARKGGPRERQLMDQLLVSALIEARSCERFKLLWQHIPDPDLSKFYYELMVSAAGHFVSYVELAKEYCDKPQVDARLQELLKIEGDIITNLPVRDDRMH